MSKKIRNISSVLLAGCLCFALNCGGDDIADPTSEPGTQTGGKADEVQNTDVRASACEVFVDKVSPRVYKDVRGVILYVKTLNDKLDGEVTEVGFYGHATTDGCTKGPWDEECPGTFAWRSFKGEPHFGAKDYFEITLTVWNSMINKRIYEGAIYAKTSTGKTYWANPQGGGNFIIDYPMVENVLDLVPQCRDSNLVICGNADPSTRLSTADSFEYLNPDRCR